VRLKGFINSGIVANALEKNASG